MPRVYEKIARKDIYQYGKQIPDPTTKSKKRLDRSLPRDKGDEVIVKAGEKYYSWTFRHGGLNISTTRPRQSQLTQSSYLSTLYSIQERIEDQEFDDPAEVEEFVQEVIQDLETLRDETQSSLDNMPEQLQESSVLNERIESLDSAISEFEGIDTSYEEPNEDELRQELKDDSEDETEPTDDDIEEAKAEKAREWIEEKMDEIRNVTFE